MKIVVDCNVVISALWKDGLPRRVFDYVSENHELIITDCIISELKRTSGYPKLKKIQTAFSKVISDLEYFAVRVDDVPCDFSLPDTDDEIYIAAAIHADVSFVITGNLKHFPERNYGSVRIISIREFAEMMGLS